MTLDPVCGMDVSSCEVSYSSTYQNTVYHFCSKRCQEQFDKYPEEYIRNLHKLPEDRKIVIVGTGQVGATCAFTLMNSGIANIIVLIDVNRELAEGHALDLRHGMPFTQPCRIKVGEYDDCRDADIVVITAGTAQKPGESRLDLVKRNTEIFKNIIPQIADRNPRIILVVTNPVDVLSYVAQILSGFPMNRVIGSGTMLDTARFHSLIGEYCDIDPRNVHGYILGEHGDSEVPVWSQVAIGGVSFDTYCKLYKLDYRDSDREEIFSQVRNAAYEIIRKKGATYYAIALAVVHLIRVILRDENSLLTVSTLLDNYYGINDVYMSVPVVIGRSGIRRVIRITMSDSEKDALRHSADVLKSIIGEIDIREPQMVK